MKKALLILILLTSLIAMTGCDYPEKSFQVLSDDEIPREVTMDFMLPMGYYASFVWTSDLIDVIAIMNGCEAVVHQQDENTVVTLTASIKETTRSFKVTVLKTGSAPTLLEQSVIAFDHVVFPIDVINPFVMIKEYEGIVLQYQKHEYYENHYEIILKPDGSVWIVPDIVWKSETAAVVVNAFAFSEDGTLVFLNSKVLEFQTQSDIAGIHRHRQIFMALEILFQGGDTKDHLTKDFILPLTSEVTEDARITWKSMMPSVIAIGGDGVTAYVIRPLVITQVKLIATVWLDDITYDFDVLVLVFPEDSGIDVS